MQVVSCHRLLCPSATGRGSRGSLVHLSWLVVGGAGRVATASAAVVVVAEDSMPMAEADTQPGEMQLFCSAAIGCKIGRDLNYVQLLGSAAASSCVCAEQVVSCQPSNLCSGRFEPVAYLTCGSMHMAGRAYGYKTCIWSPSWFV